MGMQSLQASRFVVAAVLGAAAGMIGALADAVPAQAQEQTQEQTQAQAQACPGHPDAIGTSRVLALEPGGPTRVGVMQYPQSLPLNDKEVVLTFDDGPLPRYSNQVLDILAAHCVKATYFLVGSMARAYPATVRRIYEEGHTIGTHSEHHPSRMDRLSREKVQREIDDGIADVGAALGDPGKLAPFFRIPGLARSDMIEQELAARSLIVFSSDTVADDWHRRIKPAEIVRRAMSRLEARGKGILLLHDIHAVTVAALPELLKRLKDEGFHVVHVVPPEANRTATAGAPQTAGRSEPNWPKFSAAATNRVELPAPDATSFATGYRPGRRIVLADRSPSAATLPAVTSSEWPDASAATAPAAAKAELPVPAIDDYWHYFVGGGATVTSIAE